MPRISTKEIARVLKLDDMERYAYFIEQVQTRRKVDVMRITEGYACLTNDDGRRGICFWPHPQFARLMKEDEWKDGKIQTVSWDDFLDDWLIGLLMDKLSAIVFPTPEGPALSVAPDDLRRHLLGEAIPADA